MKRKVLLVNPPGKKLYIRDYYCSKVSKSNYLFQPVDLSMLSGRLAQAHDVFCIDAIANRINENKCFEIINKLSPDIVISLIGAVSLTEDLEFLKALREKVQSIVVSGDIVLENTAQWMADHPFIDAAIMDFTSDDILHYLANNYGAIRNLAFRADGEIRYVNNPRPKNKEFSLPIPRHDLFTSKNYNFPFVRYKNFSTVLTDYGCPFKCSFCVMSTLGYKFRNIENVMDELKVLKALGKREIFFIDQTFGINKARTFELCRKIKQEGLFFGWVCYSRVDIITNELLKTMKGAGCHTIILGVESASEEILNKYQKGYNKEEIQKAFKLCKKYNIRTVATFIIGLPEEEYATARETIKFLKEIDCDFASFNIAVPRMNTAFRREAIEKGLIDSGLQIVDQSGSFITMPTNYLTITQVQKLHKEAIKEFYLRPSYLWKRLRNISTLYEFKEQVAEGLTLLKCF